MNMAIVYFSMGCLASFIFGLATERLLSGKLIIALQDYIKTLEDLSKAYEVLNKANNGLIDDQRNLISFYKEQEKYDLKN